MTREKIRDERLISRTRFTGLLLCMYYTSVGLQEIVVFRNARRLRKSA